MLKDVYDGIPEDVVSSFEEAEAEVAATRETENKLSKELNEAEEPYRKAIQALHEKMEEATRDLQEALADAVAKRREASLVRRQLEEQKQVLGFRGRIPDKDEMVTWYDLMREHLPGMTPVLPQYASESIQRTPNVTGFEVRAVEGYEDKVYLAWDEGAALRAVMCVRPSQHPGDGTQAGLVVDGERVELLHQSGFRYASSIEKPLQQFRAALHRVRDTGDATLPSDVVVYVPGEDGAHDLRHLEDVGMRLNPEPGSWFHVGEFKVRPAHGSEVESGEVRPELHGKLSFKPEHLPKFLRYEEGA